MSDTMSDLASRAQAREEVAAKVYRILMEQLGATAWRERDRADLIAQTLTNPAAFDALAGLLGYVKREDAYNHAADIAHAEARWQTELYMRGVSSSTETAERVTVVESSIRHFAGREVVTDAEQG